MVSGIIVFLEKVLQKVIHHDVFRTNKIDIENPPETRAGRTLLRAHGIFGRIIWKTAGPILIKPLLKRGGERDYILLVDPDEKIYLTNSHISDGKWRLPGGGRMAGETPLEAVRREAKEELGSNLQIDGDVIVFDGLHHEYGFRTRIYAQKLNEWPDDIAPLASELARTGRFTIGDIEGGEIPIDPTALEAISNWRSS